MSLTFSDALLSMVLPLLVGGAVALLLALIGFGSTDEDDN